MAEHFEDAVRVLNRAGDQHQRAVLQQIGVGTVMADAVLRRLRNADSDNGRQTPRLASEADHG